MLTVLFFFNDTATTEIYTLSLHDALPISAPRRVCLRQRRAAAFQCGHRPDRRADRRRRGRPGAGGCRRHRDRKGTRLNSSHVRISYAVFSLKKKNKSSEICYSPSETVSVY